MESLETSQHRLCFNSLINKDETKDFAILYTLALTIFFSTLFFFIYLQRSNIILKERCCNLLLLQTITTYGFLIVYPVSYLFSKNQLYDHTSYLIIIFFIAQFKYIPILCYLMRSFRFHYAFSESYTFFQLKSKILIIFFIIISGIIGVLDVLTEFDKNIFYEEDGHYKFTTQIPRMLFVYLSQLILIIAIFFMRKVNGFLQFDYWTAFLVELLSFLIKVYLRSVQNFIDCSDDHKIPLYYYIDCLKCSIMLICSSVLPLFFKHRAVGDLPFEMECSNFRFFISQTHFIKLFYVYLEYFENNKIFHYEIEENKITQTLLKINNNNHTTFLENENIKCPFKPSLPKCMIAYINLTLWLEDSNSQQNQSLSSQFKETQKFLQDLVQEILVIKSTFQSYKQPLNSQMDLLMSENKIDNYKNQNQIQVNFENIETVWLLKSILFEILKEIFETYFKLTKSYKTIFQMCKNNRKIWMRLGKMGLTGNQQY